MRVIIIDKKGKKFKVHENINPNDEEFEVNDFPYDIDLSEAFTGGEEPTLYYRAGHPEPLAWKKYDGKWTPGDLYLASEEKTGRRGIASMLGISGAGGLKKSQWGIIIGVVALLIGAFIFLYPKIMAMM